MGRYLPISRFIEQSELAVGIDTRQLRPGDKLLVMTRNTSYELQLAEPAEGTSMARSNGRFITEQTRANLLGATLSGSGTMLKLGWILLGFGMVLAVNGVELVTTPVQALLVNGKPFVPPGSACVVVH